MIRLIWKAIKRDVDRVTFATAKVRMSDANPEVVDTAQTDDGQTSERMVKRWAEEGISDMLMLSGGAWKRAAEIPYPITVSDDLLHHDIQEWVFTREDNRGGVSFDNRTVAILMHQFVVSYILWQWAVACMPGVIGEMQTRFTLAKNDLKEAMYEQSMPVKQKIYKTKVEPEIITVE